VRPEKWRWFRTELDALEGVGKLRAARVGRVRVEGVVGGVGGMDREEDLNGPRDVVDLLPGALERLEVGTEVLVTLLTGEIAAPPPVKVKVPEVVPVIVAEVEREFRGLLR
jgi:hypothetical protein